MMTPQAKIKWLILNVARRWAGEEPLEYPCYEVDSMYDELCERGADQDPRNEIRGGEFETDLPAEYSRVYESRSVAAKLPDKSWVGWTYYFGGGKHSSPEECEWMHNAYDLNCLEEEKMVVVRKFSRVGIYG